MLRFDGRVAVVTGAGRGLGREYALELARRGATVVVNDLGCDVDGDGESVSPAEAVAAEIRSAGGRALANSDSVSAAGAAQRIIDTCLQHFGRVDVVINNAGILRMVPLAEVTPRGLLDHFDVHVLGTVLLCQAAWPHMAARGYGRIVNTVTGGIFGLPDLGEYGPAKGAVFALTRGLALEGAPLGIGVNAVAPQAATRMLSTSALPTDLKARLTERMRPAEVAPAVVFLAHDSCSLQGETLAASGGRIARIGLSENEGIIDDAMSAEIIAARLDEVLDEGTARHWRSSVEKYAYAVEERREGQPLSPTSRSSR